MKKLYNRVGGEWLYRFYVPKFTEFISNCPSLSRNKHLAGKEKYIREKEDSESGKERKVTNSKMFEMLVMCSFSKRFIIFNQKCVNYITSY